jgi:hypothetical protein
MLTHSGLSLWLPCRPCRCFCCCPHPAADVRDLVAVYKNPPYPIFYDVVYHSYGLVPMLASPLYYSSKFSSTVLTSFITGACVCASMRARVCAGCVNASSAAAESRQQPCGPRMSESPIAGCLVDCSSDNTPGCAAIPPPPLNAHDAGVPILADSRFMAAYSMIEPNAVYLQVRPPCLMGWGAGRGRQAGAARAPGFGVEAGKATMLLCVCTP